MNGRPLYDDSNYRELLRQVQLDETGDLQILPRRTMYGSTDAEQHGLIPMADYLTDVIQPEDFKEVIQECHDAQLFPVYHMERNGTLEGWNQNGLPLCWAWGGTAARVGVGALEGETPRALAPNSLGWLTGWRKRGYYLDATIQGIRERGILPAEYVPSLYSLDPSKFTHGPDTDSWEEEALNYRSSEWWDVQIGSALWVARQALTGLATGCPAYVADLAWGHALACVAMEWDEHQYLNLVWWFWNSHNDDVIRRTGQRAVPDEMYVVRAGSLQRN